MVETLHLPYRAIESTSAVGPFFWAAFDQSEETPHLRKSSPFSTVPHISPRPQNWGTNYVAEIIFRKSDVRKKGLTRHAPPTFFQEIDN